MTQRAQVAEIAPDEALGAPSHPDQRVMAPLLLPEILRRRVLQPPVELRQHLELRPGLVGEVELRVLRVRDARLEARGGKAESAHEPVQNRLSR